MQDQAFAGGDASSALLGLVCVVAAQALLVTRAAIVLCQLLQLLGAFQLSPVLPALSGGRQVAQGILVPSLLCPTCIRNEIWLRPSQHILVQEALKTS